MGVRCGCPWGMGVGVLPGRTGWLGCASERMLRNIGLKSRSGASRLRARLLEQNTMTVMGMAGPRQHVNLGGWWGIVFSVGLLIEASIVTVPTAALSGEEIRSFYAAHRQIIVIQQLAAVMLLVPLLAFARTLDRQSRGGDRHGVAWIMLAAWAVAGAELATSALPFILAVLTDVSAGTAHGLAFATDLADDALFASIALFSVVATPTDWTWLRPLGVLVGTVTLVRAVGGLFGVTALDAAAPIAFLAFVLALSAQTILLDRRHRAPQRTAVDQLGEDL
jgi:hypothetical protein